MAHTESAVRETILSLVRQLAPDPEGFPAEGAAHLVNDLGFHSLALLELAFAIEDDFDLPPIDEDTGRGIATSDDVVAYVVGQLREQNQLVSH
ncbi:acyl carrier protein [Streptomyces sp. NPDC050564]|uniref:acyl carrier protein n=1 Tax=Streptomyces sp. NPDC050564 TaxID=3365631 RepID=UPI0037A8E467